ncbi:MAG: hypothetical protein HQK51_17925 [Oligoflexia bacterium]|nr:hypothetical protein [Oligoflexia bacterium]
MKTKVDSCFRSIPFEIFCSENEEKKKPDNIIQVLRTGTFHNTFFNESLVISSEVLASMIKNFSSKIRGIDPMIDFAHRSDLEAAAWIKNLFTKNDNQELWAEVEWTEVGEAAIEKKLYRYISADFSFNYRDNETLKDHGPTLFGAALTNRPFVKNMQPVQLSEQNINNSGEATTMNELEELKKENLELKNQINDFSKKMELLQKQIQLTEKKSEFDKLLSEGKVCPAQLEAFITGDIRAFAEKAMPINFKAVGHGRTDDNENVDVDVTVMRLAEEKMKQDSKLPLNKAISLVLHENKDLTEKYNQKYNQ